MNPLLRVRVFLLAATLAACSHPPAPSPAVSLPTLARPTVQVHATRPGDNPVVPRAAFVERGGVPGVYVLSEGRARFRMIRLGAVAGDHLEVISGLRGGERVVVGELDAVRDGSPIDVTGPKR